MSNRVYRNRQVKLDLRRIDWEQLPPSAEVESLKAEIRAGFPDIAHFDYRANNRKASVRLPDVEPDTGRAKLRVFLEIPDHAILDPDQPPVEQTRCEVVDLILHIDSGTIGFLEPLKLRLREYTTAVAKNHALTVLRQAIHGLTGVWVQLQVPKSVNEPEAFRAKILEAAKDPENQRVTRVTVSNVGDHSLPEGFTILNPVPEDEEMIRRHMEKREGGNVESIDLKAKPDGDLSHSPSARYAVGTGIPTRLDYKELITIEKKGPRGKPLEVQRFRGRTILREQDSRVPVEVEAPAVENKLQLAGYLPDAALKIHGWENFDDELDG